MIATDLKEIKDYWNKKYPTILVTLWSDEEANKYFGKMVTHNTTVDLRANTVGELINQGEFFLRRFTSR